MIYISLAECDKTAESQHLTAHNLLTSLLCDLGYEYPIINKEENGRPFVNYDCTDISISHSNNLVAVCVATDKILESDCTLTLPIDAKRIGIDIEYIDRSINLIEKNRLAKRFLSQEADSIEDFFSIWTENEAVGKMTGEGVIQNKKTACDVLSFIAVTDKLNSEYSLSIAYTH